MADYLLTRRLAAEAGICPETVRSYCARGLLKPARDSAARALFRPEDVKRVRAIYQENMARRAFPTGVSA